MKIRALTIVLVSLVTMIGCKNEDLTAPVPNLSITGQYQSVPYNSNTDDVTVILLLSQSDNKVEGTGTWNGIVFNFSGTIIDKHLLVSFNLTGTNVGDLKGDIDTYVGNDETLAGGYNLFNSVTVFSGAIKFKRVYP